jgi:hypothetical protein
MIRVKGVFRTDQGWALLNRIDGEANVIELAYRRDSRFEIISESELDWDGIEEALLLLSSAGEDLIAFLDHLLAATHQGNVARLFGSSLAGASFFYC